MKWQTFLAAAFLILSSSALPAQNAKITGGIKKNKTTLPAVDAVGVWNDGKKELTIYLMPFKLKKEHITLIRKGRTDLVLREQPSPDPKKWSWCPIAKLIVALDPKASLKSARKTAVERYHAWTFGIEKKDHTNNLVRGGQHVKREVKAFDLRLDTAKGEGTVKLGARIVEEGKRREVMMTFPLLSISLVSYVGPCIVPQ